MGLLYLYLSHKPYEYYVVENNRFSYIYLAVGACSETSNYNPHRELGKYIRMYRYSIKIHSNVSIQYTNPAKFRNIKFKMFPISGCNAVCLLSLRYKQTYEETRKEQQQQQQQQQKQQQQQQQQQQRLVVLLLLLLLLFFLLLCWLCEFFVLFYLLCILVFVLTFTSNWQLCF